MTRWDARHGSRSGICHATATGYYLRRSPKFSKRNEIGIFLGPAQRSLGAVNRQSQVVLIANRDLTGPNMAASAAIKLQRDTGIIINHSPCHVRAKRSTHRSGTQPCYKTGKVVCVGSDIAYGSATRLGSVHAPFSLLVIISRSLAEPILQVIRLNNPDLAKCAFGHHLACLTDHRVAGIIMGKKEVPLGGLRCGGEAFGLCQSRGHRLVANNRDVVSQERLGDGTMKVIWGYDRHCIDPVGSRGFGFRHLVEIRVGAININAELGRGSVCAYCV